MQKFENLFLRMRLLIGWGGAPIHKIIGKKKKVLPKKIQWR